MKRIGIYICCLWGLLLACPTMVHAQNEDALKFTKVSGVRKSLRTVKNTDDDRKKMLTEVQKTIDALVKEDTKKASKSKEAGPTDGPKVAEGASQDDGKQKDKKAAKDSTEYYFLTGLVKQYLLKQENAKMYLKNKPDTVAYFSRLYEMVEAFEHCYPRIHQLAKEDSEVQTILDDNKTNLSRGGNFYLRKGKLDEAYKFFHKYIQLNDEELITASDSVLVPAYYNCMYVASKQKNYDTVVNLNKEAVEHGTPSEEADLLYCDALYRLNRMDDWIAAVQESITRHPNQFYFYASLIDYYISHDASAKAVTYASELQAGDPQNPLKNFVKGYVYQHMGDYAKAVECLETAYQLKADIPQNLSSLGFCYVSLAEEKTANLKGTRISAADKQQIQGYYEKAKLYLERCRTLMPDDKDYWAPALYKVYYNLNDGEKMEEMEHLLG